MISALVGGRSEKLWRTKRGQKMEELVLSATLGRGAVSVGERNMRREVTTETAYNLPAHHNLIRKTRNFLLESAITH
jgi:hypothetical protein